MKGLDSHVPFFSPHLYQKQFKKNGMAGKTNRSKAPYQSNPATNAASAADVMTTTNANLPRI